MLIAFSGVLLAQKEDQSAEPKIFLFRILPTLVKGEQWYEVHWEVTNTDRAKLYREGQEMPGRSQLPDGSIGWPASMSGLRMKLTKMTAFELVAENRFGSDRKKFTVKIATPERPPEKPQKPSSLKIESFRITPEESPPGGEIKFYWDVKNADHVRLFDDLGEIDLRSTHKRNSGEVFGLSTTIDQTTTFRLEASDRARRSVSKTFTVRVGGGTKPTDPPPLSPSGGACAISGKLEGKWRQQISERPTGPSSTWTVKVYIYGSDPNRPFASATVSNNGTYTFEDLEAGETYRIKPEWTATPGQGNASCSAGKTGQGPKFRITGSPRLD